ncbi:histone-like nucleoid-structuring protein, MvaT/MvaU family [Pseudomonas sp. P8_250]|uniref:histone-like nucleoid-structuring protein, MvaT/MvaU family n=1 Tax=Pseudomonas sp. P8_250 TaxID=3043446 RepID=UPI002A368A39|nr:histone-like nucleoid-structuring protein, MvaT/MvaU family [Pseudomonas sp. P8_250]MDX9668741.1 H-NS histone [Pseudomonas sp. P8_250]
MAAKLNELRETRAALEAIQKKLAALEADPELRKHQQFEAELRALMGKFSMSLVDINQLLDINYKPPKPAVKPAPAANDKAATGKKPGVKKTRSTRTYTNPHNGETLVYVGGVNKILEEWKEKWGADTVKGWGVLNRPDGAKPSKNKDRRG